MSDEKQLKYEIIISEIQEVDILNTTLREKYIQLKRILERCCKEIIRNEVLQFPSLFSRIVFISQKYNISSNLEWQLQNIRVKASFLIRSKQNRVSLQEYNSAKENIIVLLSIIYKNNTEEGRGYNQNIKVPVSKRKYNGKIDKLRVQVIHINKESKLITVHTTDLDSETEITIRYGVSKINEVFNSSINNLWIGAQLNIIDCYIEDKTNYVVPHFIVLEPDYLIDASALAECFQNYGKSHLHYFRRKFEQNANSQHILLGNLANYFLDELVYSDDPQNEEFTDVFFKAFKQSPFEYTSCNDIKDKNDFRTFMSKAKAQFYNIQRVVTNDFKANNIETKNCTLEPSFFCEKFGFQGRLDLLQLSNSKSDTINIVELKSGGLPFPKEDSGKIAINHEAQTTIYRLIIQSVFGKHSRDIASTILYSASENNGENIRFSAPYQLFEKEIVNIRNLIISTEHDLYTNDKKAVEHLFHQMFNLDNYGRVPQFFIDKLTDIENVFSGITQLEKIYFYRFISFISRELYIQKIGDIDYNSNSGVANLWTSEFKERQESFDLIADLTINYIDDSGEDMKIGFRWKNEVNFVNFRIGEICILYPHETAEETILSNQILKGTVADISRNFILVRFRYKQKNKAYLQKYKSWAIEHDKLDHAYTGMFKNLFSFLKTPIEKRSVLLGLKKPKSDYRSSNDNEKESSIVYQDKIISKALAAQNYFLIVGPPGTGKTSIFARRLIDILFNSSKSNILVIAYTNRAVDELCEAINQALASNNIENEYIRIGSELSCAEACKDKLLQNIARKVKSREELRFVINNCRVFVGTLASISGKPELFDIKKFDIAIIDEASQILEPQIIGLLPHFDKFIMIGDHKQLSTITLQDESKSKITDTNLNDIELVDCRESYFERLFRICQQNNWTDLFDTLIYQGRMHESIARFPNKHFYNNCLQSANDWQSETLVRYVQDTSDQYQKIVSENRLAFITSNKADNNIINDKTNEQEANIAVNLCIAILEVYKRNELEFNKDKTLGIITPYRNQIALIRHKLELAGIIELENIMVDTVERYQGSQRDIIIFSFCINRPYQLDFLCNLNREKNVDRKLNVALTRARQQLFLIGNEYLLRQNSIYKALIDETEICHLKN